MNNEEIQALMKQLQDAGLTPEDIADGILWPLFRDGKMSKEDLGTLCSSIGLELDEDFDKDEGPEGADKGEIENISKEEAEEAKEIKPGESKEEFAEKLDEAKETPVGEEEESEEKSEEDEWDDVKKNIFKL